MCVGQGLVQRFTSAFEETKREVEGLIGDVDHSMGLQLASKLNSEDLAGRLQEASLVTRSALHTQLKQVSSSSVYHCCMNHHQQFSHYHCDNHHCCFNCSYHHHYYDYLNHHTYCHDRHETMVINITIDLVITIMIDL